MKQSHLFFAIFFGALVALPIAVGAQTEKTTTLLQVSVGDVTDTRSTGSFSSECKVELKFTGDAAADAGNVRQVHVQESTDELGRNLVPKKGDDFSMHSYNAAHQNGALRAEVRLRNPSRNASVIKLIKGEVELFSPTEANGALLTISNVLQHPTQPIENPVLAKYGIQLMYLTKETYEAKKKEIAAQKKSGGDATGSKLGDAFADVFKGMFGGMMSGSKNSVDLYIKDPKKMVINFKLADSANKPLKSSESWSSGDFHNIGLDTPAPADAQLLLQIATPEAIKTLPFKVENIPLP